MNLTPTRPAPAQELRRDHRRRKLRDFLSSMCFSGPSFAGMLVFYIIPFGVIVYYSLIRGVADHGFAGLQNYRNVIQNGAFQIAVKNTAAFSAVAVPGAVILAMVLALMLEARIPWKSQFRTFFHSIAQSSVTRQIPGAKPLSPAVMRMQSRACLCGSAASIPAASVMGSSSACSSGSSRRR